MTGRWEWPWTPAPMSATSARPGARPGPKWRIATPLTAAVRWAVIGPPSRIAIGMPVAGSLSTTDGADPGQAERRVFVGDSRRPTSCRRGRRRVAGPEVGRHGVDERAVGPGVDRDLGRQLRGVRAGRARSSSARRGGGAPRAGASPPRRRPRRTSAAAAARPRRCAGMRTRRPAPRRRAEPSRRGSVRFSTWPPIDFHQSLDNLKLERDAIALYDALARIEKDPRRAAGVPHRSPATSGATPRSGPSKLRELGAAVPPRGRPAPAGPDDRARRPALRDPRRARHRPGARGRRGGPLHGPGLARGRGDRRRRARARRDLAADQREAGRARPSGRPRRSGARTSPRGALASTPAGRGRSGPSSSASRTGSSRTSPS